VIAMKLRTNTSPRRSVLRRPRVLAGILALSSALAVTVGPPLALADEPLVNGGGSSYAAVALNNWAAQVKVRFGMNINYNTSSSVQGLNEFALNQLNFAASEIGYSTKQADQSPSGNYQYLPDVAGATCIDYHLTAVNGSPIKTLLLNSAVMARIFTGQIKYWDDPQVKALNPSVLLPHKAITVVWREDPSGDNYLFSQYLNYVQPSIWQPYDRALGEYKFGNYATAIWPFPQGQSVPHQYDFSGWVGQSGSDNASYYVSSTDDSITQVETAYAIEHGDPCAYIQNASGNYVQPSEYNDAVALTKAQLLPDLEQLLAGVYSNKDPHAYPISAYSYLVTHETGYSPSMAAELGKFIQFIACDGQQTAGTLGYSPLPPILVARDFQAVDRIAGAAKLPSEPSAADCANPYVDGTLTLPGPQPVITGGTGNSGGNSGNSGGNSGNSGGNSGTSGNSGGNSGTSGNSGGNSGTSGNSGGNSGNSGGNSGTSGNSGGNSGNSGGNSGNSGGNGGGKRGNSGGKSGGSGFSGPSGIITGPKAAATQATQDQNGIALLGATTVLTNRSSLTSGSMLWLLLGSVVVLVAPPAYLRHRRRREDKEST
jgi:phosphate ABC transporter phosphate-binding protein